MAENSKYTYRELEQAIEAAGAFAMDESNSREAREAARRDAEQMAQMAASGDYRDDTNPLASLGLGISQGATLGFGDELWAGARAGYDRTFGEATDIGEAYAERLEENRRALADARREDPYLMLGGEFAGGALTGGAGLGRAVAGRTLLSAMRRGATTGAGLGGLTGYGYSEGDPLAAAAFSDDPNAMMNEFGRAASDSAFGAGMGAMMGGTLPTIGTGAKKLFNKLFVGKDRRLSELNRRYVLDALQKDVDAGHTTWRQIEKRLSEEGSEMVLGDMGPFTRELMENVMHSGTEAGTALRTFVRGRNQAQWTRLNPELAKALRTDGKTFAQANKLLLNRAKREADELYDVAYSQPVRMTPAMRNILGAESFGKVNRDAARLMRQELISEGADANALRAMQIDLNSPVLQTRDLDYVMRVMDGRVNALFKSDKSADQMLARSAKALRNQFREEVYRQNKYLRLARDRWSNNKAIDDAMQRGKNIFREDFEGIEDIVDSFGRGERVGFRIGVAKAILNKLGNKSFDADLMKGVFDRPASMQAIKVAFGSPKRFSEFMRYVGREKDMFESYRRSLGSETKKRLSAPDIWDQAAKVGGYGVGLTFGGGIPPSLAGWGAQRVSQNLRRAMSPVTPEALMSGQAKLLQSGNLNALRPTFTGQMLTPGASGLAGRATGAGISTGGLRPDLQYGLLAPPEDEQ